MLLRRMLEILVDKVGVAIATKCTTMMLIGRVATCMGPWHGSPLAGLAVSSSSSNWQQNQFGCYKQYIYHLHSWYALFSWSVVLRTPPLIMMSVEALLKMVKHFEDWMTPLLEQDAQEWTPMIRPWHASLPKWLYPC